MGAYRDMQSEEMLVEFCRLLGQRDGIGDGKGSGVSRMLCGAALFAYRDGLFDAVLNDEKKKRIFIVPADRPE